MLVCTVTACVGVTACVCRLRRLSLTWRGSTMSSWLRPAYGISMRKEKKKGWEISLCSLPLSETNQRPGRRGEGYKASSAALGPRVKHQKPDMILYFMGM